MGETKNEIFKAALDIFSRFGYHGASMQQIAEIVGIKKASLYNHFPSKESILEEVLAFFRNSLPPSFPEGILPAFPATATVAGILTAQIDGFMKRFSDPMLDCAWTIISEEQYLNPEACAIIIDTTEIFLSLSFSAFKAMQISGLLRKDIDLPELSAAYAYGFRAMHLEYGLRKRHGLSITAITERMYRHAEFFASLADIGKTAV